MEWIANMGTGKSQQKFNSITLLRLRLLMCPGMHAFPNLLLHTIIIIIKLYGFLVGRIPRLRTYRMKPYYSARAKYNYVRSSLVVFINNSQAMKMIHPILLSLLLGRIVGTLAQEDCPNRAAECPGNCGGAISLLQVSGESVPWLMHA